MTSEQPATETCSLTPTPLVSLLSSVCVKIIVFCGLYLIIAKQGHSPDYLKGWVIGGSLWLIEPFTRYFMGRSQ